jgi:hypothetical protein
MFFVEEPGTFVEAEPHECWRLAMLDKLSSIEENAMWTLMELPAGHCLIGLKWVFKTKKEEAGIMVKHKAWLIAKGYVQREGVDFDEVYTLVAHLDSVRVLVAIAAQQKWQVHHLDMKSAFMNGDLQEEVYVTQPPSFERDGKKGKVYRLHKALYGLRQAPRTKNHKLDATLKELGFSSSPSEHAMYAHGQGRSRLLLGIYVDDLIVTAAYIDEIARFKLQMKDKFNMSNLGSLRFYLGIEVSQSASGIILS